MRHHEDHSQGSPNAGLKVLVVDDARDILDVLVAILEGQGHEARSACNGELALSQINEFKPDCILLDVNMPVMDGYELAQTLKTYIPRQTIMIGMSGGGTTYPSVAGILPLVDRWFQKPIDLEALIGYIDCVSKSRHCSLSLHGDSRQSS